MAKLGFEPRYVQQQSTCSLYSVILVSSREKASLRNWKTKRSIQSDRFLLCVVPYTGTQREIKMLPKKIEPRWKYWKIEDLLSPCEEAGSYRDYGGLSRDLEPQSRQRWRADHTLASDIIQPQQLCPQFKNQYINNVLFSQKPFLLSEIHLTSQTSLASVHMLIHIDSDCIQ